MTQTIIVASTNPVKIGAALSGFQQMFPSETFEVKSINVPSGVPDQPMTVAETRQGATNRALNAREAMPEANYWIGIEGGIDTTANGQFEVFAWVIVLSPDRSGASRTGTFTLPDEIASLVREGLELGKADDQVFGRANSKQQNGAVGILTDDVIDRQSYYVHAVILALIPLKNTALKFS